MRREGAVKILKEVGGITEPEGYEHTQLLCSCVLGKNSVLGLVPKSLPARIFILRSSYYSYYINLTQ